MGYTTVFDGSVDLVPSLNEAQIAYLKQLCDTRRMKRKPKGLSCPYATAVGFKDLGTEGEFFVSGTGCAGQDTTPDVTNSNEPPGTQPGLWCNWTPTDDGSKIVWNKQEKFYEYERWLQYIMEKFMTPWGISCAGEILCSGEDPTDMTVLSVANNVVTVSRIRGKDLTKWKPIARKIWKEWNDAQTASFKRYMEARKQEQQAQAQV